MDKSKIAEKEIEVAKWMSKKGYDRRASKDVAPIIVEYLSEFKLLDLHSVTNRALLLKIQKLEADNKLLNYMVENGLGEEDMINDITYPHEL